MPMPTTGGRLGAGITKEAALTEIRRRRQEDPAVPPEVVAFGLMRHVDSWEEHSAIIAAVDAFWALLAEQY